MTAMLVGLLVIALVVPVLYGIGRVVNWAMRLEIEGLEVPPWIFVVYGLTAVFVVTALGAFAFLVGHFLLAALT